MTTKELKNKISDALSDAEAALSKSKIMVDDLYNGYFGKPEPEAWALQMYYNDAQTKNSISNDYLFELDKELKKIRELLQAAEQEKNEHGKG